MLLLERSPPSGHWDALYAKYTFKSHLDPDGEGWVVTYEQVAGCVCLCLRVPTQEFFLLHWQLFFKLIEGRKAVGRRWTVHYCVTVSAQKGALATCLHMKCKPCSLRRRFLVQMMHLRMLRIPACHHAAWPLRCPCSVSLLTLGGRGYFMLFLAPCHMGSENLECFCSYSRVCIYCDVISQRVKFQAVEASSCPLGF